jgi:hypothetical protein
MIEGRIHLYARTSGVTAHFFSQPNFFLENSEKPELQPVDRAHISVADIRLTTSLWAFDRGLSRANWLKRSIAIHLREFNMATLSADQPIMFFDTVECISRGHPVFLLGCVKDGSYVVIKQENLLATNAPLLKHNLQVMKQVSPLTATSKVLTPGEIAVLQGFAKHWIDRMRLYRHEVEPEGVKELRLRLERACVWYKMPRISEMTGLSDAIRAFQTEKNRSKLDMIAKALNDVGGFERLGQIIAVDLYNSNHDRFDWSEHAGMKNPITGGKFKCLRNVDNVLLAIESGKFRPIGLDSFDYINFREADITKPLATVEKECLIWSGRILGAAGKAELTEFLKKVIDDLNSIFGTRERRFEYLNKYYLKLNAVSRLEKGVRQGADAIRSKLERMLAKPGANPELLTRLKAMT